MSRRQTDNSPSNKAIRGSVAQYVRNKTQSGEEMVDMMYQIMKGVYKGHTKLKPVELLRVGMEAAGWLMDRGFGKAPQPVDLDVDVNTAGYDPNLTEFETDELRAILVEVRARKALLVGTGDVVTIETNVAEEVPAEHGS